MWEDTSLCGLHVLSERFDTKMVYRGNGDKNTALKETNVEFSMKKSSFFLRQNWYAFFSRTNQFIKWLIMKEHLAYYECLIKLKQIFSAPDIFQKKKNLYVNIKIIYFEGTCIFNT